MLVADSQDSCTQMQGASLYASQADKYPLSCANIVPDGGILEDFYHRLRHYATTSLQVIKPLAGEKATCPVNGRPIVVKALRYLMLETLLPEMHSDKGRATLLRRWHGVADECPEDEAARRVMEGLAQGEDYVTEVYSWVRDIEKIGSSLSLWAPPPPSCRKEHWQGPSQWVDKASQALASSTAPRLRRVGAQHQRFILQALSSFADQATGCGVTASNKTIGERAAEFCARHIKAGGSYRGRRTDELSARTLQDHVSCVVAALIEAGWIRERARGRKLSAFERVEAWARFRIFQTQAASVRDLVIPEGNRVDPPLPNGPAWCTPDNPFVAEAVLSGLVSCVQTAAGSPVLRNYPSLARLPFYVQVLVWYLTRKKPSAESPPSRRRRKKPSARPSLAAQRLVAKILTTLPWLLRRKGAGKRLHSWTLARVVDSVAPPGFSAEDVLAHIDHTLQQRHWELHPEAIADPIAWFTTVLKNIPASKSVLPDGGM